MLEDGCHFSSEQGTDRFGPAGDGPGWTLPHNALKVGGDAGLLSLFSPLVDTVLCWWEPQVPGPCGTVPCYSVCSRRCPTAQWGDGRSTSKNSWSRLFQFFSGSKLWVRRMASKSPSLWPSPGHPWLPFQSPGTSLSEGPVSWVRQCSRMERTGRRPWPPLLSLRRVSDLPVAKKRGSLLHPLARKSLRDTSTAIMLSWQPFILV